MPVAVLESLRQRDSGERQMGPIGNYSAGGIIQAMSGQGSVGALPTFQP